MAMSLGIITIMKKKKSALTFSHFLFKLPFFFCILCILYFLLLFPVSFCECPDEMYRTTCPQPITKQQNNNKY